MMFVVAGFDRGWKLVAGVLGVHLFRHLVILSKWLLRENLFFPVAYFETVMLSLFLIIGLLIYQRRVYRAGMSLKKVS